MDVSLMIEKQKELPENIMFVLKRHDLLPQVIFHTVIQLIEREEVNELNLKLSDTTLNMTRTKTR